MGNDTSKSTGRSGRQKAATRRNMRREERVTVQGPVKEQQPDGMSHRGCNWEDLERGLEAESDDHSAGDDNGDTIRNNINANSTASSCSRSIAYASHRDHGSGLPRNTTTKMATLPIARQRDISARRSGGDGGGLWRTNDSGPVFLVLSPSGRGQGQWTAPRWRTDRLRHRVSLVWVWHAMRPVGGVHLRWSLGGLHPLRHDSTCHPLHKPQALFPQPTARVSLY